MANLPESAVYDAGVYQLETSDPVQGGVSGVSNSPLKNLANRTTYLKSRVDGLEAGTLIPPTVAPLASPTFTGDPKGPTAAAGDNDTSLATTAFVQLTTGGRLSKSVAGGANVTLTAVEAGNAILDLFGTLTANIAVIVPASPTRAWIVKNGTGGAFTVTVKTAAGTGVVVVQGRNQIVWTDGTNVYDAHTEFDSIAMTGDPTAPTAAQFDNDLSVATTEFVQRALGSLRGQVTYSSSATLGAADVGKRINTTTASNITLTLPDPTNYPSGAAFFVHNTGGGGVTTLAPSVANTLNNGGTLGNIALREQSYVWLVRTDGNFWLACGGSAHIGKTPEFGSSLGSSGWQRLPSGLIVQWGSANGNASGSQSITFPVAFPTGCRAVTMTAQNPSLYATTLTAGVSTTGFQFIVGTSLGSSGSSTAAVYWIAIGD